MSVFDQAPSLRKVRIVPIGDILLFGSVITAPFVYLNQVKYFVAYSFLATTQ